MLLHSLWVCCCFRMLLCSVLELVSCPSYSCVLVGSYIMGSFSDRLGRHLFISISLLGQVIGMNSELSPFTWKGCIGQSLAKNLWLFIGCRLFTGLFDCTLVIVQAYATLVGGNRLVVSQIWQRSRNERTISPLWMPSTLLDTFLVPFWVHFWARSHYELPCMPKESSADQ